MRTLISCLLTLLSLQLLGQVVVSTPLFPTIDDTNITITFDASLGSGGLKDFTGDVYAHSGLITEASSNGGDWKGSIPAWNVDLPKYKMTRISPNLYTLYIGSIRQFYEYTDAATVQKIAFVFRNTGGTKEGKDVGGKDIYISIYEKGLNINIVTPEKDGIVALNSKLTLSADASLTSDIKLLVNDAVVAQSSASKSINHEYTFAQVQDYNIVVQASLDGVTVADTVQMCVPNAALAEPRPSGVKDGINIINDSTITFVMFAPNKEYVHLIGDFNQWKISSSHQLKKDGDYFWITISNLAPNIEYGFQYLVDGSLRVSDAYATKVLDPSADGWINEHDQIWSDLKPYPTGKTDGLVAVVQTNKTPYQWQVSNFKIDSKDNLIIYELLLRDFTKERSLQAAISRLDYLKTLGVNAIELMPITEFDGNNSWGYNPNHFFATDKAYGDVAAYKRFIDECHKRGIAVIVDMVFNHATGQHPFAKLYWNSAINKTDISNPWFNVDAPHGFSVYHDFNHEYSGTRNYFKQVLKYWLEEFKIDGYRMDLTKGFTQKKGTESAFDQSRIDILTDYHNAVKQANTDAIFILEHFCNASEEQALAAKGMYLWRNANNAFSQAAMGYSNESAFSGLISSPRHWVGYGESHDEERNFFKAKNWGSAQMKTDEAYRVARVPANIAFITLLQGPKMIWQFGELGYDIALLNYTGGDTEQGKTDPKPVHWEWLQNTSRKAAYATSSAIINLRTKHAKAFTEGTQSNQISASDWSAGRRISLTHNDLEMVVIGNFTTTDITAKPNFQKTGIWFNYLTQAQLNVVDTQMDYTLAPGQVVIFTDRKVDLPNIPDYNFPDAIESIQHKQLDIYPTLVDHSFTIASEQQIEQLSIYNTQGCKVMDLAHPAAQVDVNGLAKGIYLIRAKTESGLLYSRIIKQ